MMQAKLPNKIKLVRDHYVANDPTVQVVALAEPNGILDVCTSALHQQFLRAKIIEEMAEVGEKPWDIDEYGDVLQAFICLVELSGLKWEQVLEAMHQKAKLRGAFYRGKIAITDNPNYLTSNYVGTPHQDYPVRENVVA